MTGNGCYGNIRAGIGTQTGERANIVENECRNNTRAGIGVRKEGNANILSNQCVENKPVGIRSKSDAYIARNDTISCSAISIPSATLYEQQRRYWLRNSCSRLGTPTPVAKA